MKQITIIGGGASGTLLAANLLKSGGGPLAINIVERNDRLGRGVAYSTDKNSHLLNVPAAKMGAFPEDVDGFHRWLGQNGLAYDGNDFVPRRIFGRYLRDVLSSAAKSASPETAFRSIDDEVVDIEDRGPIAGVILKSGTTLESDKVVLAFGNFFPPHPNVEDQSFISVPKYFQNPWEPGVYDSIERDENVFIVGTGLSMVDVVLHLHASDHRGKITAISTRGLLPAVHRLGFTYPSFQCEIESMTRVTDLLKTVRRHIDVAMNDSSDWRAVVDSLRPHTQSIWLRLPTAEKRYFMQHLSRYWNVARHRMPPIAAEVLDSLRATGQLEILRGRLKAITYTDQIGFDISYTSMDETHQTNAHVLLNCIGSESNFTRIQFPLVQNLLSRGLVRPDEVFLGLKATPDGHIIDCKGVPSNNIFTLGTALKGTLWESTAIPEIRVQARDLALNLRSA